MRPGQNKRMRGRNNNNNNNRKGPNPLTRSYESNGPDVKIRGTAHHIAEKYLQLARDAQTSGDPVAAESYLQHAEHYFRLIATAQQAQMTLNRPAEEADLDETDEDEASAMPDRFASPFERPQPTPQPAPQPQYNAPQPYPDRPYGNDRSGGFNGERQPYNGERPAYNGERPDRQDRGGQDRGGQDRGNYEGGRRNDRFGRGPRPYRDGDGRDQRQDYRGQESRGQDYRGGDRPPEMRDGPRPEGGNRSFNGGYRDRPPRPQAEERQPEPMAPEVTREPIPVQEDAPGLPAFITAPVRLGAASDTTEPAANAPEIASGEPAAEAPQYPPRRRRRPRSAAVEAASESSPENSPPNE